MHTLKNKTGVDLTQGYYYQNRENLIKQIFTIVDLSVQNALGKFIRDALKKRENSALHILPTHNVERIQDMSN